MRRLFWVLLLASSLLGCAAIRGAVARQETLDREIGAYVIQKPLADAWTVALSEDLTFWEVVAGRGLKWEETGKWQARSAVEVKSEKKAGGVVEVEKSWVEAEGVTAGDGSQIHFFVVNERHTIRDGTEGLGDRSRTRALEMELAFIKKLDPQAGAAIEKKAQSAEQAARAE
ncbi:MAG: hypothetical protein HOV80_19655 [Polyangiaceae bacterium]|nr:hypothetical protein [Polyangiaceae bacterium]